MTKKARHLEILIGICLILLGLGSAYLLYESLIWQIEFWNTHLTDKISLSWIRLIADHRLGIISTILFSSSGYLLLKSNKLGWYFATIVCFDHFLAFLALAIDSHNDPDISISRWFSYSLSVLLLFLTGFLFSNQVRSKYDINLYSIIVVGAGIIMLFIDRFLI